MRDDQFVSWIRAAIYAADIPAHTPSEILSCGCEPEIEHCGHCDALRQANAKRDEALQILAEPDNEKRLLGIIDKLTRQPVEKPNP